MKKKYSDYYLVFLGLILLGLGLFLIKTLSEPQGLMRAFPYVCVGLGCGIFGHGMGNIVSLRALKNNPDIQKRMEIEKKDERNIAISHKAKAKAYDMMLYVFGALMLSFALMGIDMVALLLLVFAFLFIVFYGIFCRCQYDKEM